MGRVDIAIRSQVGPVPVDWAIGALAGAQYGVVSREQLRDLGLTPSAIDRRVAGGRLQVVHRGVYAVGHRVIVTRGRWMAAVLACGSGAALSHAAAAALWELRASEAVIVDVTARRTGRSRPGIRIHRPRTLRPNETTTKDGIPVTTPARTILDLAAKLDGRPLERLLDQAESARLTDVPSLAALARAHAGHRGASKLRAALEDHEPGTTLTKSELEERFLALCRRAGLPRPNVNDDVEGLEVDFVFKDDRVLVETDSWRHHKSRDAFENDRRRDATHAAAGYRTLRFTHRQIAGEPATVAATIAAAMSDRRAA
jgi:very-short-patch-repair endonuclease